MEDDMNHNFFPMPVSWYDDEDEDFADEMAQLDLEDQLVHIIKMENHDDCNAK
jgi:hypothetical protein